MEVILCSRLSSSYLGDSYIRLTILRQYGNETSWGLSYNMYADKLLGTNVFPPELYEMRK